MLRFLPGGRSFIYAFIYYIHLVLLLSFCRFVYLYIFSDSDASNQRLQVAAVGGGYHCLLVGFRKSNG
jgi:hypothetical protein